MMGHPKLHFLKFFALLLFTVSIFSTCGCSLNPKRYLSKKINFAGIVKHEPSSFAPVETGTFHVSSDQLVNRRHHKGGKTSLLWGLFTYTDY